MKSRSLANSATAELSPLLSTRDLIQLLGICRRTLERMRSAGLIPPPDLRIGRLPRWKRSTIAQWLDQSRS